MNDDPARPQRRVIPIAGGGTPGDCTGAEPFALQVIGDSMAPEFEHGDVIVVEPEGHATDGSFVVARHADEWIFRQLLRDAAGWRLHALDPACADVRLPDLASVRGVVIQKSKPGRRRAAKRYID